MPYRRARPDRLAGFRRGGRAALEEVYWAYVERVETTAARYVGVAEVPDVVQETFLRAFREGPREAYDAARDYGPYLATIARNLAIDRARRAGREIPTEEIPEPMESSEEPWADPLSMKIVEEYLADLAPDLKALHETRYERGLSQRDAAETLGISRQQLRTRELQLREGLAARLQKK
jgi:RNA polymerase sigma-70 factor, ECF subfamily